MTSTPDFLLRRLRMRHLELLAALSEVQTLRNAATRMHLSQPAISKMLNEIEECFAEPLFERSHQGVKANALGAAAIRHAKVALNAMQFAFDDMAALKAKSVNVLRIGAPSVTASIPAAVVRMRQHNPAVMVRIQEGTVVELVQRLLEGALDCVFAAITPDLLSQDLLDQLHSEMLVLDELCVLSSSKHPLAQQRQLCWAQLQEAEWVTPPKHTLVRQAFTAAFLNQGLTPPEPVIEVMSSVTVGAVLRLDPDLLCAVRLEQARAELSRDDVRYLRVEPRIPLPSFGLFTRKNATPASAALEALARELRQSTYAAL